MARVVNIGWEINSLTAGINEFDVMANAGSHLSNPSGRTGLCARCNGRQTVTAEGWAFQFIAAATAGQTYHRFYFKVDTAPSSTTTIWAMWDTLQVGDSTPGSSLRLRIDNSRQLILTDGTNTFTSSALTAGTWYKIEIAAINAAAQTVELKVNGTSVGTSTSWNTNSQVCVAFGSNLTTESGTNGDWSFDDYAMNDATGSVENSYPTGDRVRYLYPAGDAGSNTWQLSDFSAGTTDNWKLVDDGSGRSGAASIPDDASSYLCRHPATGNSQTTDEYSITDPTSVGFHTADLIGAITVSARMGATSGTAGSARQITFKLKSGSTTQVGAAVDVSTNGWNRNGDVNPKIPSLVSMRDPATGGGTGTDRWTTTTLAAAVLIMESSLGGATSEVRTTAVWLAVDSVDDLTQNVTAGLLTNVPVLFSPTVVNDQAVTVGLLTNTPTLPAPSVNAEGFVDMLLLSNPVTLPAPSVKYTQNVTAGLLTVTPTLPVPSSVVQAGYIEWSLPDEVLASPPGVPASWGPLTVRARKANTGDVGDIQFTLYSGGSPVQGSAWIALTDTATDLVLAITNPVPDHTDLKVGFMVRRYDTDTLDPQIISVGLDYVMPSQNVTATVLSNPVTLPAPSVSQGAAPNQNVTVGLLTVPVSLPAPGVVMAGGPQNVSVSLLTVTPVLFPPFVIVPGPPPATTGFLPFFITA